MRILLDVDGVVANFVDHLGETIGADLRTENCTSFDVFKLLSSRQQTAARLVLSSAQFWRTQRTIAGAHDGVDFLDDAGHDVCFVTSPYYHCREWDTVRREWLGIVFGPAYKVVTTASKEFVKGDVFVDDKPEHVLAWKKEFPEGRAFVFDAPYNRACAAERWYGWDNIPPLLLEK